MAATPKHVHPRNSRAVILEDVVNAGERSMLAMWVLAHPNIRLATTHVSKRIDGAVAQSNAIDSLLLMHARRSSYDKAPGGDVGLSVQLLRGMLALATTYSFVVSEIAGGKHGANSRHYAGVAMDVVEINDVAVSAKNVYVAPFMRRCRALGATEVLGPGHRDKHGVKDHEGHVHVAWPRPKR